MLLSIRTVFRFAVPLSNPYFAYSFCWARYARQEHTHRQSEISPLALTPQEKQEKNAGEKMYKRHYFFQWSLLKKREKMYLAIFFKQRVRNCSKNTIYPWLWQKNYKTNHIYNPSRTRGNISYQQLHAPQSV